jgi:hypothetical protein
MTGLGVGLRWFLSEICKIDSHIAALQTAAGNMIVTTADSNMATRTAATLSLT